MILRSLVGAPLAAATVAAFLLGFPAGLCASISERARAPLHNLLTVTGKARKGKGEADLERVG